MDASELRKKLQALLWHGKTSEAMSLLDKERKGVRIEIADLEGRLKNLRDKERLIAELGPDTQTIDARHNSPTSLSTGFYDKESRNEFVLKTASSVASANVAREVNVNVLAGMIKDKGVDLGVALNREATALANILSKSGGYKKVRRGVYQPPQK